MASYRVPLNLVSLEDQGCHLFLEIIIFGQPVFAVLDTGASCSVFDQALAQTHVGLLKTADFKQANTIFSTAETQTATIPLLQIGKLKIADYKAFILDLSTINHTYTQLGHPQISAIIGGDILLRFMAKIDYRNLTLHLHR